MTFHVKQSRRKRTAKLEQRAHFMWQQARYRAKKSGIGFYLDESWVLEKLENGLCEVTWLPFVMSMSSNREGCNPWGPSIDRIDSSKGYIPENVRMVCWLYNLAKSVYSHSEVVMMAKALCGIISDDEIDRIRLLAFEG